MVLYYLLAVLMVKKESKSQQNGTKLHLHNNRILFGVLRHCEVLGADMVSVSPLWTDSLHVVAQPLVGCGGGVTALLQGVVCCGWMFPFGP